MFLYDVFPPNGEKAFVSLLLKSFSSLFIIAFNRNIISILVNYKLLQDCEREVSYSFILVHGT